MAARAIWKGIIALGDSRVPVKLYSAVEDRRVHFRLLDDENFTPVKQRMVNPRTGEEVPRDEVRKGYETAEGAFVILGEQELETVEPEGTRDIEISRFVEPASIGHAWYDRPYFLGPDGDEAPYFALAEALRNSDREGVAHWVMRKKEYSGALRVDGDYLMLVTLRRAGEVIPASALEPPAGRQPDAKEFEMADQLLSALEDDFDPAAYHNEYRERVMELVEAKATGATIQPAEGEPEPAAASLDEALAESIKRAKEERASAA